MSTLTKPNTRVAKWDNTKAFLILMVVLGHSLSAFLDNGSAMKWVDLCINTFHMPLFIFIGGLFAKRTINSTPFKYEKVVSFLLLSLFMKGLTYFVKLICTGKASFTLLSDNSVSWYIFAMAIHLMIAHLLRNCQPWKILLASTVIAILIGYVDEIGNTFVLSRIIVFFPIFYLGYASDADKVLKIVNKPAVRIGSLLFIIAVFAVLYFTLDISYFIRRLLTGNNPYHEFGETYAPFGAVFRIIAYILSFTVGFAVLSIMPNKHLPLISYCGTRTLQVYALHRPIQLAMGYIFLNDMHQDTLPRLLLPILFGISLVLTLVLSLKPFEYILYPCTKWQVWLGPVMNWFKRKQ